MVGGGSFAEFKEMQIEDIDFNIMQMWIQVYWLNMDMYNPQNAKYIGDSLGRCVGIEIANTMTQQSFLRVKVEIDVTKLMCDRFQWTNTVGQEKWATVRYGRLSDFCYGCDRLGHTSQACNEEIAKSERKTEFPKYGLWLVGSRQRTNN